MERYNHQTNHYLKPQQRNQQLITNTDIRGSWTPFSWVEKYRYLFSGPFNKAEIYLTFDDGPDEVYTHQILEELNTYNAKATFFVLGEQAEKYPDLVRRIASEGHLIGNHTYNHPNFNITSLEDFQNQIIKTENIIRDIVGYNPIFIRPPFGNITEEQLEWASETEHIVVQWSIDTLDWRGLSGEEIAGTVMGQAFPGSIVVQHNAFSPLQGTVDSLGLFIPQLQSKGARFVTLSELLGSELQI